jgi:hypothetical protein
MFRFLLDSHFEDGGEAACQAVFDLSIGDLVMDFLGEGEWAPMPNKWSKKVSTGYGQTPGSP